MRTTVNVAEGLLERAKQRARRDGRTLGEVIDASLQLYLARAEPESGPEIPVFDRGRRFRAGIDPTSNASLFAAADEPSR